MTPYINALNLSIIVFLRYVVVAGGFYLVCYKWKKSSWKYKKLGPPENNRNILFQEFKWSIATSIIFGIVGAFMFDAWEKGRTLIYNDFDSRGLSYTLISLVLMMFIHDTYFYWTHRLLHIPWFYRKVHRVHHLSIYPSPWASFCFHPVESVIQALCLPLIVFIVPTHPAALIVFLLIMTVLGVVNHVGYELYPSFYLKNKILRTFIGATNHSQHHLYNHCNFGLYFTWWDWAMGTLKRDRGAVSASPPTPPQDTFLPQPPLEPSIRRI